MPSIYPFVYLNGAFLPHEKACISIQDRGFLYGDGVFETMRLCQGRVPLWERHVRRMRRGLEALRIAWSFGEEEIRQRMEELRRRNQAQEGILRWTVSRGAGERGYSTRGATKPTVLVSMHRAEPWPFQRPGAWRFMTASQVRIFAGDPLARYKTSNRLIQILARAEAEAAGADEALLVSSQGHVVEAASGNLFWWRGKTLCTPPLGSGVLPGVTREAVLQSVQELGMSWEETQLQAVDLPRTDGAFITMSTLGMVAMASCDNSPMPVNDRTDGLYRALRERMYGSR